MKKDPNQHLIDQVRKRYSDEQMILLESQMPGHPSSEFSYLAIKPLHSIQAYGNRIEWMLNGERVSFVGNPWDALKKFRDRTGGWLFGYLGYELKDFIEELHSVNQPLVNLPDLCFFEPSLLFRIADGKIEQWTNEGQFQPIHESVSFFEPNDEPDEPVQNNLTTFDPKTDEPVQRNLPPFEPDQVPEKTVQMNRPPFEQDPAPEKPAQIDGLKPQPLISQKEYHQIILEIQRRIGEGDFYELNYSYPLSGEFTGDSYELYRKMREINPVPFGSFIRLDEFSAGCASPERFLQKRGNRVISEPIKGTAERSADYDTDRLRKSELLNEKNRAENLMIVDLVRHDLSKIAIKGSVNVSKLYDIQSFGTVHQLISTIEAMVDEKQHPVEIIKSCFPMGSMTGAPKIEVMKVIDELENYRRGLYSGAIGYLDPDGDFDFNVVIRTAIMQNQRIVYPVGGAITSDSDPEQEWLETEIKSRSITNVFEAGE